MPAPEVTILADVFAVLRGHSERIAAPGSHRVFRESATRVVIETMPSAPPVAANDQTDLSIA